jgi:hypothetical protein
MSESVFEAGWEWGKMKESAICIIASMKSFDVGNEIERCGIEKVLLKSAHFTIKLSERITRPRGEGEESLGFKDVEETLLLQLIKQIMS